MDCKKETPDTLGGMKIVITHEDPTEEAKAEEAIKTIIKILEEQVNDK